MAYKINQKAVDTTGTPKSSSGKMTFTEYLEKTKNGAAASQPKAAKNIPAPAASGEKMTFSQYLEKTTPTLAKTLSTSAAASDWDARYRKIMSAMRSFDPATAGWSKDAGNGYQSQIISLLNEFDQVKDSGTALYGNMEQRRQELQNLLDGIHAVNKRNAPYRNEAEYSAAQANQKKQAQLQQMDTEAGKAEIAQLEKDLERFTELTNFYGSYQDYLNNGGNPNVTDPETVSRLSEYEALVKKYGSADNLSATLARAKVYNAQAERAQTANNLSGVGRVGADNYDPQFAQKHGYKSTEMEGAWKKMWSEYGLGYSDLTYEYINNKSGIRDRILSSAKKTDGGSYEKWKALDHMSSSEIDVYNYHYANNGKEVADQYLDSILESLNQRRAAERFVAIKGKTGKELLFGVQAGFDQFDTGLSSIFSKEDYIPATSTQYTSAAVREDLATGGNKFSNAVAPVAYDLITTTANMVPSVLSSVAIGIINPTAGAAVGQGLMGASAAGNAYREMLNSGYSKEDARTYGFLVGASEVALEKVLGGISALGGGKLTNIAVKNLDKVDNLLAKFARSAGGKILMNAGSEAIEEFTQSVIEPYLRHAVSGEELEADWEEAMYSGMLGFLTGGLFEAGTTLLRGKSSPQTDPAPKTEQTAEPEAAPAPEKTPAQKGADRLSNLLTSAKRLFGKDQSPVDTAPQTVYDESKQPTTVGGMENGRTNQTDRGTGLGDPSQGMAGVQQRNGTEFAGGQEHGGMALHPGVIRVSPQLESARKNRGIESYDLYDTTQDPSDYEQALISGRNSDPANGWCVTPKSAKELAEHNVKTLMNAEKTVGVGIAPDGDIVAVFKNRNGGPRKALDTAMPTAIEMGGDRLDCYGEGLVRVYERYGFVPVARVEFNPEYANEGWTPEKGAPFIYFMMHNGDAAADVTQNMHKYGHATQEQLDALPTYGKDDYDAAMQYRNDLIDKRKTSTDPTANLSAETAGLGNTVGAAEAGFTGYAGQYDQLLSDDNVQPQRPGAVRDLEVPKKDAFGRDVSKFASNAAASKVTPETFIPTFQELGVIGALGKDTKTQAETLENAENWIRDKGTTQARAQILSEAFDGKVSDNAIAAAFIEYTRSAGNISAESQNDAAEMFVALEEMATNSGRNLNLFKLFQRMTPEGQTMAVEKSVQKYVEKLNKGRSKKNQATVTIPQQLLDDYKEAARAAIGENATQEQIDAKDAAVDAIYMAAASQIKSTLKEKWDGVRHFSMLGNFKTQVRNEGGNIAMRPFVTAKRAVGAALEKAMKVPQEQRTKAVLGLGEDAKALLALAKADAQTQDASDRMSRNVKTGDQARTAIDEYRKTFDYTAQNDTSNTPDFIKKVRQAANTAMEAGSKGVSNFMENRDMFYKRWEYRVSLASFIKARGYTAQQWQQGQIPANVMEEGRSYAAQEAMKATFNDRNTLTEALGKLRYHGDNPWKKAASIAGEGLLPYLSTPANVALRAKDYSAAGFVQGVAETATKVKSGDMTAAEAIDHMASGLTGMGVNLLGYALASGILGIRLVGAQDDEDKERTGHQAYSLEIGDKSYTIDWAAPVNIPLFVGANLYKVQEEMGTDDVSAWAKFATVAASTFEPMLELSVLSSVADLFDTARTARDGTAMYSIAASIATSYLTQGLPTVFSQFDQLGGKTRQMVYATSEDPTERAVQKLIGKVTQRLPGDAYQTDYVDAWGRTSKTNWFESVLSPSYAEKINETKADKEIMRLNKAQDTNVTPKTPGYTVTVDGKETRLTADQWSEMAKAQGQKAYSIVDKLIRTGEYQKLNDSEKAAAIERAYDYAKEYARSKVLDGYEISTEWMKGIDGKEAEAIAQRALQESTGLTQARYERAVEAGVSIDDMRQVTAQVGKRLEGTKNKTAYDSYRAVIESVGGKDRDLWLEIYGLSDTRLEEMRQAKTAGIPERAYINYLEAQSKLDAAFGKITAAWKDGKEADLEPLALAYDTFDALPQNVKNYFQGEMGGRLEAFANAIDAGIPESTFVSLWKQYYDLGETGSSSGANANEWASILDNAKNAGQITARQRNVLWNDLGFYAQIRQDAAKYHDMTKEGLKPDKARYVADLMSGVDTLAKKLETISGASLTDAEKEQATRAYLTTDTQEEKLDKILAMGMDMDTYAQLYGGYSEAEGRKSLSVESFMDMGLRRSEAVTVWQIFAGKK